MGIQGQDTDIDKWLKSENKIIRKFGLWWLRGEKKKSNKKSQPHKKYGGNCLIKIFEFVS